MHLPKFNKKLAAIMAAILLLLASAGYIAFQYFGNQSQEEEQPAPDNGEPTEQPEETPPTEEFSVTKATASVNPSSYSGTTCPKTFTFTGKITTNKAGTVKYYWERSNGYKSASTSLKFSAAGTKSVTHSWAVNDSYSGWARVNVTSPNSKASGKASFTFTCVFAVTKVTASVSPSSSYDCDQDYTFTGKITVNKAGTVKYKWERIDGYSTPTKTLTFTGAGTKSAEQHIWHPGPDTGYKPVWEAFWDWLVSDVWAVLPSSPNIWERIKIISPSGDVSASGKAQAEFYCSPPV
jgi:hypothetical protein